MARAKAATTRWDVVDYLDSDRKIAAYLEAALEDGDPQVVTAAIGDIARARHDASGARNRIEPGGALQGVWREWQSVVRNGDEGGKGTRRKADRATGLRPGAESWSIR
jgi:hypothetical protein